MSDAQGGNEAPWPAGWKGRRVGLLDALVWGREQVRMRHALWLLTAIDTVDSLTPFIRGWSANVQFNGGSDVPWQEFCHWLREEKGEPLREDWYIQYLNASQGDHEKAALVLLDWATEYQEKYGWAPRGLVGVREGRVAAAYGPLPREWGGRRVGLLDALLWVRRKLLEGCELVPLTGHTAIQSLYSFTFSWFVCDFYNEREDPAKEGFYHWLADVRKEFPGEGWHVKYLRDCQGDHRRAVLKFLDFVDEYVSLQAPTKGR